MIEKFQVDFDKKNQMAKSVISRMRHIIKF